jgi:hypothetical protein
MPIFEEPPGCLLVHCRVRWCACGSVGDKAGYESNCHTHKEATTRTDKSAYPKKKEGREGRFKQWWKRFYVLLCYAQLLNAM